MLRRLDTNGNGMIDAEEVAGQRQRFIEGMLSRFGIEPKYPLSISQISQSMANAPRPGGNGRVTPPSQSSPGSTVTVQPGFTFGVTSRTPVARSGFAQPSVQPTTVATPSTPAAAASSTPSSVATPTAPASPTDQSVEQKIRALATAIIQKYDKNGDGKLGRDEWSNQGKFGTFSEANRSGGDFIENQELIAHLTDYQNRHQLSLDSGDYGDLSKLLRRSSRFLTPRERLDSAIPAWFLQKDRDGDGQVTMAEFSNDWTPQTVSEFNHFDLNRDGIVTAAECLKVLKQAALTSK